MGNYARPEWSGTPRDSSALQPVQPLDNLFSVLRIEPRTSCAKHSATELTFLDPLVFSFSFQDRVLLNCTGLELDV